MADCDTLFTGMDYHDKFDPSVYLTYKYGEGRYILTVSISIFVATTMPSSLSHLAYVFLIMVLAQLS